MRESNESKLWVRGSDRHNSNKQISFSKQTEMSEGVPGTLHSTVPFLSVLVYSEVYAEECINFVHTTTTLLLCTYL